jgi:radical SAM protein with 4Fe4S-binding SPASM domain
MSDQVFKKIIQAIKTDKISPTAIILNGFGDPLTDNKIIYRINRLKTSFPSSAIKIYTNLSLASQSTLKNLIKSGLDEINISLNGIDRQSYQKIMGLDYSRVVNNLRQLIKVRNKSRSDLIIRLSYALIEKNEKNYSKFVKRWKKAVDSVSTNKVHSYSQTFLPQGKIHTIDFNRKPFPCKNIFNTVVFTVTGDISLCCLDYEASHTFGNIQEKRPLEIFNSIKFNQYRQAHLSSNLSKLPICNKCYAPYKGGIEWLFDKLY